MNKYETILTFLVCEVYNVGKKHHQMRVEHENQFMSKSLFEHTLNHVASYNKVPIYDLVLISSITLKLEK